MSAVLTSLEIYFPLYMCLSWPVLSISNMVNSCQLPSSLLWMETRELSLLHVLWRWDYYILPVQELCRGEWSLLITSGCNCLHFCDPNSRWYWLEGHLTSLSELLSHLIRLPTSQQPPPECSFPGLPNSQSPYLGASSPQSLLAKNTKTLYG